MFCIKCGAKIVEGAKFCQKCGAPAAASGPPSADGAQVSPAGKPAAASLLRNNRPRRRPMYPRKSPIQQGGRRHQEGRLRRRPLSSQVLHLPRGTREQVRPRRLASLAQTAKEPPTGSRFSNRRAARRTSLRWGSQAAESLSDTSPLAIRARACHPSPKRKQHTGPGSCAGLALRQLSL